jgi:hypothetical protein
MWYPSQGTVSPSGFKWPQPPISFSDVDPSFFYSPLPCSKDACTTYLTSKPASKIDPDWITWSLNNFANLDPHSKSASALIYATRKRCIGVIFKWAPMKDQVGKLEGITGNIFNEKSATAFTKINCDEIGSCFAIQQHSKIPIKFCPNIALKANIVKDTEWEFAEDEIALCVVPILAPIPFGKNIESTFNDSFIKEIILISVEHGFWAKLMSNVTEQAKTDRKVKTIVSRLVKSSVKQNRNPCRVVMKGFRTNTFPNSAPFIDTSILGQRFPAKQAFLKEFLSGTPLPLASKKFPMRTMITFPKYLSLVIMPRLLNPPSNMISKNFLS